MECKLSKAVIGSMVAGAALVAATTDEPKFDETEEDDVDRGGVGNDQRDVGQQDEI